MRIIHAVIACRQFWTIALQRFSLQHQGGYFHARYQIILFLVLARPMHPSSINHCVFITLKASNPFCRKGPPNQIISGTTLCRQTICLYRTINCRHDNSLNFLNSIMMCLVPCQPCCHCFNIWSILKILLLCMEAASSQIKISNPASVFTTAEVFTGVTNFRVNPSQHTSYTYAHKLHTHIKLYIHMLLVW